MASQLRALPKMIEITELMHFLESIPRQAAASCVHSVKAHEYSFPMQFQGVAE